MVDDDEDTSKDKEIDKLMALISLSNAGYESQRNGNVAGARETVGSSMVQKSGIQCYNCKEYGHVARECQKPKRAKDAAYQWEKMLLCKQEEAGIQLNVSPYAIDSGPNFDTEPEQKDSEQIDQNDEDADLAKEQQADWKDDTDDESELEAHYMYMANVQEVSPDAVDSGPIFDTEPEQKVHNDDHYDVFAIECQHSEQSESVHKTYLIEQDAHDVIIESVDMNYDSEQIDQNDEDVDLAKERELLASLIEKLKFEIDESKNRNKFLETSNKVLVDKLKSEIEDFKNKNKSLELSYNQSKEANNKLSKENDLQYADFKKSQAELARRNSKEYALQMEIECAKARGDLLSYKMDYHNSYDKYTKTINDLNQTILELQTKLSAHQDTISILKQQKDAQI
nr:hypothetical protein [Tanacetum cinerariifolium]